MTAPEPDSESSIRLDQFLKMSSVADTGGQAKLMIQGGEVMVNGEVELRRRRKLVPGDSVGVAGEVFVLYDDQ
ncbi:MAG: RNA-binding S4 domain-containing protein [Pirellulaceae bacterium]